MKTLSQETQVRLLEAHELIRPGDCIALRRPEFNGGGYCCSLAVHPNFYGHPKSDALFEVARTEKEEDGFRHWEWHIENGLAVCCEAFREPVSYTEANIRHALENVKAGRKSYATQEAWELEINKFIDGLEVALQFTSQSPNPAVVSSKA